MEKKSGGARPGAGKNKSVKVGNMISFRPDEDLIPRINQMLGTGNYSSRNRFINDCIRMAFFFAENQPEERKEINDSPTFDSWDEPKTFNKDGFVIEMYLNADGSVNLSKKMKICFQTNKGTRIEREGYPNPDTIDGMVTNVGSISGQFRIAKIMRDIENLFEHGSRDKTIVEV